MQHYLLQVCKNCNMVAYCSNRCRVAGTAEHRLECLILSRSQHYNVTPES